MSGTVFNEKYTYEDVVAILRDDIEFYIVYRRFAPSFVTASLDETFCMSFRVKPNAYDQHIFFSKIQNEALEDYITENAGYCFGVNN